MADKLANEECTICLEKKNDPAELPCKHSFCATCLQRMQDVSGNQQWANACPLCRAPIKPPTVPDNLAGNEEQFFEFTMNPNEALLIWADDDPNTVFDVQADEFMVQSGVVYDSVLENGTPVQIFEATDEESDESMEDDDEEDLADVLLAESPESLQMQENFMEAYDYLMEHEDTDRDTDDEDGLSELLELACDDDDILP